MLALGAAALALQPPPLQLTRRAALLGTVGVALPAVAEDYNAPIPMKVLTEEEMAARVARKQELLRAKAKGGPKPPSDGPPGALDSYIGSDVNPDAAVTLRSRSVLENAQESMRKQDELKNRSKAQKREDLCEMLGRGC